ncbi:MULTISPECIES: LysR family transcriptional regulator [Comamonas]|uniref:LysR family transcriptional regulator n=1 Tax=Comamonas avium TaxID=2762231 RepID=A0ABR8SCF3_9BURK|nr:MULTISPECIES: LysR family transcriptional regulator [Comamonas]MBD7961162.1 LysR family transcriptional regulator [Comamonas avium]MBD9401036.1 LysR family transcriptional regulator [Comamonas sp. CMM02]
MREATLLEKIDLHLIRVLHTVIAESSVSRAAVRLGMHQPAVSTALKRLRDLSGDPILVRSGSGMQPTDAALSMLEPAAAILQAAENLFTEARAFDPRVATRTFRIAASDYLDPLFLPQLVAHLKKQAPLCTVEIMALNHDVDYSGQLAQGDVDIVIGNWPQPPAELRMAQLFADDTVCLVSHKHPAVRRGWKAKEWLDAEHIAPMPTHPGAKGVIDEALNALNLRRNIAVRCAHFGLMPQMVASSLLVLTTGRQFCERYAAQLPLAILPPPIALPQMRYYQLWHDRTHHSSAGVWLREAVKNTAMKL